MELDYINKYREDLINEIFEETMKRIKNILPQNNESVTKKKIVVFGEKNDFLKENFNIIEFCENTNINQIDSIYITNLSCEMLTCLSNLLPFSKKEQFILDFLASGKKVYIFKNNIEYKKNINTMPKSMYKKYLEFENILKTYNISFIEEIKTNNNKIKKLISLNNVNDYLNNNKLILEKNMIISPLLKDFINENNIILERR